MAHGYVTVGWNRQKRIYDAAIAAGILAYLALFAGLQLALHPSATIETILIRGLGTCALLMLHVILSIGPLARLEPRFLPLLYNRRHLGVSMFCVAAAHGLFSIVQFHAFSDRNPLVSVLVSDGSFRSGLAGFPFQPLGALALAILFLMAATSHDFWLANLTAPVWKTLHMLVYLAYALLVAHVALGALQPETSPVLLGVMAAGVAWVVGLHLVAAAKGRRADRESEVRGPHGWVDAGALAAIPEGRAVGVTIAGERVAVYRHGGRLAALSAVCRHQNGPLDEGRIVDGCVTCPWHGYQYVPDTGASPPPFTETVPTFDVAVAGGRVYVDPVPHVAGRGRSAFSSDTAELTSAPSEGGERPVPPFYVGYLPTAPAGIARFVRRALAGMAVGIAALAGALVVAQNPFAPSLFEFGVERTHEGILREHPYPALEVAGSGDAGSYALVAPGKFGAGPLVQGLDGARVRLDGALIERRGRRMLEVKPGSIARLDTPAATAETGSDLGPVTVRGEIVDAKCFLGVMNPGSSKVHRACAVRCISGGAPPILWARGREGSEAYLYLTGADGRALNREVLPFVAAPVEIAGRVERVADRWYLRADPRDIRRLD